jgi:hypothetical protein
MALRLTIENVRAVAPDLAGMWRAELTGAEIRRLGEPKTRAGTRSIIAVADVQFLPESQSLSFSPSQATVLNIGGGTETLLVDIGAHEMHAVEESPTVPAVNEPRGDGDADFISECRHRLNPTLVDLVTRLLQQVRQRYPGRLVEGEARKWVNRPVNFMAITPQHVDRSFAIYVQGRPTDYHAPTLTLKPGRGPSYCRFKLKQEAQLADAIRVVLDSAARMERR